MKRSKENLKEMESYSTLLMQMMLLVFIAYFVAIHACISFVFTGFSTGGFAGNWVSVFTAYFSNWSLIRFTVGIPLLVHIAIGFFLFWTTTSNRNQSSDDAVVLLSEAQQRRMPVDQIQDVCRLSSTTDNAFLRSIYCETERMCREANIKTPEVYCSGCLQENAYTTDLSHGRHAVILWLGLLQAVRSRKLAVAIVAHELGHIISKDCTHHTIMGCGISSMLIMWSVGRVIVDRLSYNLLHPKNEGTPSFDKWAFGISAGVLGRLMMFFGCIGCLFGNAVFYLHRRQAEFIADSRGAALLDDEQVFADAMIVLAYTSQGGGGIVEAAMVGVTAKFSPDEIMRGLDEHPDMLHRIRKIRPSFDGDYASAYKEIIRKYNY